MYQWYRLYGLCWRILPWFWNMYRYICQKFVLIRNFMHLFLTCEGLKVLSHLVFDLLDLLGFRCPDNRRSCPPSQLGIFDRPWTSSEGQVLSQIPRAQRLLRLLLPNLGSTTGVTLVDRTCSPPLLPMRSNSGLSQPLQCMNVACYMRGLWGRFMGLLTAYRIFYMLPFHSAPMGPRFS